MDNRFKYLKLNETNSARIFRQIVKALKYSALAK